MGNAESAPSGSRTSTPRPRHHNRNEPLKSSNSHGFLRDRLSSGSSHNDNDDWDHEMRVSKSNENVSPNNQYTQSFNARGTRYGNKLHQKQPSKSQRGGAFTPRERVPRDPEEDGGHDSGVSSADTDYSYDEENRSITSALMEASAAVFQYLTQADDGNESGYTMSDDESIAHGSAAVFEYLQQEADSGNDKPIIQFLETAQVVSDALLEEEYGDRLPKTYLIPQNMELQENDDVSGSKHKTTILKTLSHSRSSPSEWWLETKQGQDTDSVISEMSHSIMKVFDETKQRVNKEGVAEFSAAVNNILKDQKSRKRQSSREWDADSISEHSTAIFKILDRTDAPEVSMKGNTSTKSSKSGSRLGLVLPPSMGSAANATYMSYGSHLKPTTDPIKLMERNIFHILAQRNSPSILTIREAKNEEQDEDDEGEKVNENENKKEEEQQQQQQQQQQDVYEIIQIEDVTDVEETLPLSEDEPTTIDAPHVPHVDVSSPPPLRWVMPGDPSNLPHGMARKKEPHKPNEIQRNIFTLPSTLAPSGDEHRRSFVPVKDMSKETSDTMVPHSHADDTSDQEVNEIQDGIDLNFVERFDHAFDEFIGLHPRFVLSNPNLVHNLRIAKLQKLLEHMDQCESNLLSQVASLQKEKQTMETEYQQDLREASREKADCQIHIRSQLTDLSQKIHFKRAQIMWKIVNSSEACLKKQYLFKQNQKKKRETFFQANSNNLSGIPTRVELLQLLPNDKEGIKLKEAVFAERKFLFHYHHEGGMMMESEQMRKYQVENAFMSSEISVLKNKLTDLEAQSKRLAWVDSILLRMNKVQMAMLKKKFTKKLGVVSLD